MQFFMRPDFIDILAALILDFTLGDPKKLYHPVRIIGNFIAVFEKIFLKVQKSSAHSRAMGILLWVSTVSVTLLAVLIILNIAYAVHPLFYKAVNIGLIWMGIAAKSLKQESMSVFEALRENDISKARERLSFIVGRDTEHLSSESIVTATVETVAENTSDGVIAPLFFALIGGAPLMWVYKAVNTLDSMVGYTSEKYKDFGYASAKMDDIFNYLPARATALLLISSSFILGYSFRGSFSVWRSDRRNHRSPNSGHPESAAAGALGIKLGGDSVYSGQLIRKPVIGIGDRHPGFPDIRKVNRLMETASVLFIIIGGLLIELIVKGGV